MLPFKSDRKEGGSMSMPVESQALETNDTDYLEYAAEELLRAIQNRDIKAMTAALRSAFDLLDTEPHDEGEHY